MKVFYVSWNSLKTAKYSERKIFTVYPCLYVCFSSTKKIVYTEKMSSDSKNIISLILMNKICY